MTGTSAPSLHEGTALPSHGRVLADLVGLRRSQGLSRTRLANCEALLALPVVGQRAGSGNGQTERISALLQLLTSLLTSVGDVRALAARNAMAIGLERAGTLTERRNAFAERHAMSVDTVRRAEDAWFSEVAYELLEMSRGPGSRRGGSSYYLSNERILLDGATAPTPYRVRSLDQTYRFTTGRRPSSLLSIFTVEATGGSLEEFLTHQAYSGGRSRVAVEAVDGCTVEEAEPRWSIVNDTFSARVTLTPPLEAGHVGRALLRHVIAPSSLEPRPVFYRHIALPYDQLTLRVHFDSECMPSSIAAFESRSTLSSAFSTVREGEMSADQAMVVLHVASPELGHTYGLHWDW